MAWEAGSRRLRLVSCPRVDEHAMYSINDPLTRHIPFVARPLSPSYEAALHAAAFDLRKSWSVSYSAHQRVS